MVPGLVSMMGEAVLCCCSIPGRPEQLRWYVAKRCRDEEKKRTSLMVFSYTIVFVLYALFTFVAT